MTGRLEPPPESPEDTVAMALKRVAAVARSRGGITMRQIEYDRVLASHPGLSAYCCRWNPEGTA